jgi:hypothetical protein
MAWVGFGMVVVGGVLIYSAYKNLSPWQEFLNVIKGGAPAPVKGKGGKVI